MLTDADVKYLIEKTELSIDSRKFNEAIKYLAQLIENTTPHPYYFKRRAFCFRMIENFDRAINDYNEALKLEPDDGITYWERGACYNDKPYFEEIEDENQKKYFLQKALDDYKASLNRTPTSQEAWLAIIDICLCLNNFYDAVGYYADCKPHIESHEYKVIRSWYGCLALTFAGEAIGKEDPEYLYNQSIRLKWNNWAFYSIDILLKELEQKGFETEKLEQAKEIHRKFIEHFDEPNLCFKPKALIS